MDSGMISKIEKAMLYAKEPERITFNSFSVSFEGDHKPHIITYSGGNWHCDCSYSQTHSVCSHIMTLERVLNGSVKTAQVNQSEAYMDSGTISKIEKAMLYAQERERITFDSFDVTFTGDNHKNHTVIYSNSAWSCSCSYFQAHAVCSHVMTLERVLTNSVAPAEAIPVPA
jgi:hypothetical protein